MTVWALGEASHRAGVSLMHSSVLKMLGLVSPTLLPQKGPCPPLPTWMEAQRVGEVSPVVSDVLWHGPVWVLSVPSGLHGWEAEQHVGELLSSMLKAIVCICSVVSDSLQPHGLYIGRGSPAGSFVLKFSGRNTGAALHFLLQGSSLPGAQTHVSVSLALVGVFSTTGSTWEAP